MKLIRLAAPIVACVALLSGCAQGPSVVASGQDFTVREAELEAAYEGCKEVGLELGPDDRRDVVSNLVHGAAFEAMVDKLDLEVSDEDVRTMLRTNPQAAVLIQDPRCERVVWGSGILNVVREQVTLEDVQQFLAEQEIEVNPRYGAWSPESLVVEEQSGSLAVKGTR